MVTDIFTQKEILLRMMDKLDSIEGKLNETHEQALSTNGKVRLHTKLITAIGGALITLCGWLLTNTIR